MTNSEYWESRAVERVYEAMMEAESTADAIAKVYLQASRYIEKQPEGIFDTFKRRYGLTAAEAQHLISELKNLDDIEDLKQKLLNSSDENKTELLAELESAAYRARIERFVQLQKQIDVVMQTIYKQELQQSSRFYKELAGDSYYKALFDIQQRIGFSFSFSHIDEKQIDSVLQMNWSGKHYSKRIWDNTQELADRLKEELLVSLLTGKTEWEATECINKRFAAGAAKARRLVRTESNYISTELNFQAYEVAGIEEYQFLATLDLKTSEICRSLDGNIYQIADRMVGQNCPPMHPWCRSTTISVVDRGYIQNMTRSARDPKTGKLIKVPRSMNYGEWYRKFVA